MPRLRTNGGEEHEPANPDPSSSTGEADRRLRVDRPIVVLGETRHAVRETGRVDHRINACERIRHVAWRREIAHHGATRLRRQHGRAAQQNADLVAALRQLLEQMPPDEASGTGERNERNTHGSAPTIRQVGNLWSTVETRMLPIASGEKGMARAALAIARRWPRDTRPRTLRARSSTASLTRPAGTRRPPPRREP